MRQLNITTDTVLSLEPNEWYGDEGTPKCSWEGAKTKLFVDLFGGENSTYTVVTVGEVTGIDLPNFCYGKYDLPDWPRRSGSFAYYLERDGVPVVFFPPLTIVLNVEDSFDNPVESMLLFDGTVTDEGTIDVQNLAGFAFNEMGVWFGSLEVLGHDPNLIDRDKFLNPDRHRLGYLSFGYHNYISDYIPIHFLNTYIPLRIWLDTLEPQGNPEQYSVWVPVPFYPRSSQLNYSLKASVSARLRVWGHIILKGFDAYF